MFARRIDRCLTYPWLGAAHGLQDVDLRRASSHVRVEAVVDGRVARRHLLLPLPVAVR